MRDERAINERAINERAINERAINERAINERAINDYMERLLPLMKYGNFIEVYNNVIYFYLFEVMLPVGACSL